MMDKNSLGVLTNQFSLEENYNRSECNNHRSWVLDAYEDFISVLQNKAFPCLFGRNALKKKSLIFLFVSEEERLYDLKLGVTQYINFVKNVPVEQRLHSPLIIIFENSNLKNINKEHTFCWEQLQTIHDLDTESWPSNIPLNPENNNWTFCFGGIELFVNMSCPSHKKMKSRNLGRHITFIINPRGNFDIIAGVNDKRGIEVRNKIRERIKLYNDGIVPNELGFYGEGNSKEWKQYQLNEPNSLFASKCPLSLKS